MLTEERAVSPVVGVALLIAIVVLLAVAAATAILGLGVGSIGEPEATLSFEVNDAETVVLIHEGGEPLPEDEIVFVATGDTGLNTFGDQYGGDALTAGERVEIDEEAAAEFTIDEELTVVWENPREDGSQVLATFRP